MANPEGGETAHGSGPGPETPVGLEEGKEVTHERNVLIWLAGHLARAGVTVTDIALAFGAVFLAGYIAFLLYGCKSITLEELTEVNTPNEAAAVAFAACHGEHQGIGATEVHFYPEARDDGAVAWACKRETKSPIHLVRSWVNDSERVLVDIEMVVAHEVCHCADFTLMDGTWEGEEYIPGTVDFCAALSYRDAGCREEPNETDATDSLIRRVNRVCGELVEG